MHVPAPSLVTDGWGQAECVRLVGGGIQLSIPSSCRGASS